jgi:hypothetical protein
MGKCSYYLMKGDNYSIEAENVPCSGAISQVSSLSRCVSYFLKDNGFFFFCLLFFFVSSVIICATLAVLFLQLRYLKEKSRLLFLFHDFYDLSKKQNSGPILPFFFFCFSQLWTSTAVLKGV